jgi:hypothetical protein
METNNYIESWHNQLKTMYLERKRNRRVDRLVYILAKDVEHGYNSNVALITLKIGRMGPEERRKKRREIAAEKINEEWLQEMITLIENDQTAGSSSISIYQVKSFTSAEQSYNTEVCSNITTNCTCFDFQYNKTPCKHMYLLKRLYPTLTMEGELQHEMMFQSDDIDIGHDDYVEDSTSRNNDTALNKVI